MIVVGRKCRTDEGVKPLAGRRYAPQEIWRGACLWLPGAKRLSARGFNPSLLIALLSLFLCHPAHAARPAVTSYPDLTARLKADAARSPLIRVVSIGKSAHGGRDLWLVRAQAPGMDAAHSTRILFLCRQHGDEPASTEAILGLIDRLASGGDASLRSALAHTTFYFVPMANPDGAAANTRRNGVGADLNRDWGPFQQPETRALAGATRRIAPALVIDAHNWDGDDEYDADCLEVPRAAVTPQEQAEHSLQQNAVRALAQSGYAVHPTAWGEDAKPTLAHRWFANQGYLSALVETHYGSPADTLDFQRRQGMYVALVHALARRTFPAAPAGTQEAALFPAAPPSVPALPRRQSAPAPRRLAWLWAFGLYGLALWALRLGPVGSEPPTRTGRYYSIRKVAVSPPRGTVSVTGARPGRCSRTQLPGGQQRRVRRRRPGGCPAKRRV